MKKMRIDEVCLVNPRQSVNLPENSKISFVPMAAVSVNGQVDSCDTLELKKAKNYTVFQNGDVLFAKITPCMENGKGAIVRNLLNGYGAGSTEFIVLRPKENVITAKWLYLYLSQRSFRWECQQHMTGSAGQKRVPPKYLASCEMPVPSIEEQERIVSKIEELFSRLDASVAELKTAKEKLKVYRQAVLKEAFTGLSNKRPIREMTSIVTSGSRGWAKYYSNSGAKFIRIGNLTRDSIKIDLSEPQYVSPPVNAEGARTKLQPNDVLVSITADLGSIGLVTEVVGGAYINQHIALVRFKNSEQSEFMAWYLRSDWGQKDLLKNKRGAGKLGLGLNDIRDAKVPVVSDEQAKTIVFEISGRLSVCDSIEQTIDTSLQKAEAMRQSILKQAFEGRL